MAKVQAGQFVQVHYIGTLADGTVFDNSQGRDPLEFQMGAQNVIPGFENAVRDMEINEEKRIQLGADDAYGPRRDDMQREFETSMLGEEKVTVGQELWFSSPHGPVPGKVLSLETDKFTVDFNHPLAGKDLIFQIKLVGITDQPTQASGCSCGATSCGPDCSC